MNEREPDWAHVARSLGKVLAVTAALWLAFTAADRTLWLFVDTGHERMAQVYGTAARLANPDKRLDGHLDRRSLLETTYRLWGEPRRAGPSAGGTEYTIVENAFGRVRAPGLGGPSGSLSDAIDSVDTESSPKVPAAGVQKVIDGLPQTLHAVAVVDFTESMTSDRLAAFNRRHGICGGADVSYIYATSYYDDSAFRPCRMRSSGIVP